MIYFIVDDNKITVFLENGHPNWQQLTWSPTSHEKWFLWNLKMKNKPGRSENRRMHSLKSAWRRSCFATSCIRMATPKQRGNEEFPNKRVSQRWKSFESGNTSANRKKIKLWKICNRFGCKISFYYKGIDQNSIEKIMEISYGRTWLGTTVWHIAERIYSQL